MLVCDNDETDSLEALDAIIGNWASELADETAPLLLAIAEPALEIPSELKTALEDIARLAGELALIGSEGSPVVEGVELIIDFGVTVFCCDCSCTASPPLPPLQP